MQTRRVDDLAKFAAMSVSSFHHYIRALTAMRTLPPTSEIVPLTRDAAIDVGGDVGVTSPMTARVSSFIEVRLGPEQWRGEPSPQKNLRPRPIGVH